ncbi:hypothetical protein [Streptomyces sp. NPDC055400]
MRHDHDRLRGEPLRLARGRVGGRREPQPHARDQGHPERDGDQGAGQGHPLLPAAGEL